MPLNAFDVTPSTDSPKNLPLYCAKVEACLTGLHRRHDVDSAAHAIVAIVSRELDSAPRQTLHQVVTTICDVLLACTTKECYDMTAALHASVCISIVSAVPSYVHDPAICTAAGTTFSTRQLVHYQILAVMRDAWNSERRAVFNGTSLRRVTLCAFVDELWCRGAATDRLLYDYLGLLCLTTNEGLGLEVKCLCQILLRRGPRLWQQQDSRPLLNKLHERLSAARKRIEVPSALFNMLEKLDELQRRGWTSASDVPTGLAALKDDPEFRAVLSRLGAISRDSVSSRWAALGWPIVSQEEPSVLLPPSQLDQWLTGSPLLPKLDTHVDISLSMKAPILQLSWETLDIIVDELSRWAYRCDGEQYSMSSLISILERDLGSDSSWHLLYYRAVCALMLVPGFEEKFFALPPSALSVLDGDDSESEDDAYADPDGLSTEAEVVGRKVKSLLNTLTMERFDSISDQIIEWANKSEKEKDGRTLIQVVRLVFEKATDEATWSHMYARLCRKMMEQISDGVMDEGIKNAEGQPIKGGLLFRKYLLNRCQEDFERGWSVQAQTAAAAREKAEDDAAKKKNNEASQGQGGEEELYSDEYYAAQKAKRRGPGLVRFIGELFKLQMLTERIMHECIKKLLSNADNPGEEEIESICTLLSTVGQALDTSKARSHMDIYFRRMRDLLDHPNIDSRMRFMLQDIIELRERNWIPRDATTEISKSASGVVSLGLASVFAGKKGDKREHSAALSRSTGINPFAALTQIPGKDAEASSTLSRREPSVNFSQSGFGRGGARRKLQLFPRSKPLEEVSATPEKTETREEEPPKKVLSEAQIKKQIQEDTKEFFAIKKLNESEQYFESLPEDQRYRFVDAVFNRALEGKVADATLAGNLFALVLEKGKVTPDILEKGFSGAMEFLDDVAVDAPAAYALTAKMLHLSRFDEARVQRLAKKIVVYGDPVVAPQNKLLKEFKKLSS